MRIFNLLLPMEPIEQIIQTAQKLYRAGKHAEVLALSSVIVQRGYESGDLLSAGFGYYYEGVGRWGAGDMPGCLESYIKAISIGTEMGDLELQGKSNYQVACCYREISLEKKALEYLQLSYHQFETLNTQDPRPEWVAGMSRALTIEGQALLHLKMFEESQEKLLRSIELKQQINHAEGVATSRMSLGLLYLQQHDAAKARPEFEEAIKVLTLEKFSFYYYYCLSGLAICELLNGNAAAALEVLQEMVQISEHNPAYLPILINALEHVHLSYAALGQHDKAYETLLRLQKLNNERHSHTYVDAIALLEAQFDKSKREQALQQAQLAQAKASLTALRAQMNPHFIFNAINSIGSNMGESNVAVTKNMLNRFALLMRHNLDMAVADTVTLEEEIDFLTNYLELEKMRFGDKLNYIIDIADDLETELIKIPAMIVQPYVENSVKHGLHYKEQGGHINIAFTDHHTHIQCIVRDNGIGRDQARELKAKKEAVNGRLFESKGLKITEARLKMLNGEMENVSIEINDLKDDAGMAAGTEVIINIKA